MGQLSEVIPEDEDRGGSGAIGEGDEPEPEEGGTGADDGGPGSQNM